MRRLIIALAVTIQACATRAQPPDGAAVFQQQCAAQGQGLPGQFPPLAQNPDIFLARDFPLRVVLFGLNDKITVNGKTIDSAMPPLGDVLKDQEMAAAVNYVRGAWGNDALHPKGMAPVTTAMVAKLREQKNILGDVFSYRHSLKAGGKN